MLSDFGDFLQQDEIVQETRWIIFLNADILRFSLSNIPLKYKDIM